MALMCQLSMNSLSGYSVVNVWRTNILKSLRTAAR